MKNANKNNLEHFNLEITLHTDPDIFQLPPSTNERHILTHRNRHFQRTLKLSYQPFQPQISQGWLKHPAQFPPRSSNQ